MDYPIPSIEAQTVRKNLFENSELPLFRTETLLESLSTVKHS